MAGFNLFAKPESAANAPFTTTRHLDTSDAGMDVVDLPQWMKALGVQGNMNAENYGFLGYVPTSTGMAGKVGAPQQWLWNMGAGSGHYAPGAAEGGTWVSDTPTEFARFNDSDLARAALQGNWSGLNGTPYDVIDANTGNVIGQKTFQGLKNEDNMDLIVAGLVGAGLGGFGLAAANAGVGATGLSAAGGDAAGYGAVGSAASGAGVGGAAGVGAGAGGITGAAGSTGVTGLADGTALDLMYGGGADLLPGASGVAGATLGGGGSFAGSGLGSTLAGSALQGLPPPANPGVAPASTGVPPPANPFNVESYLNAENLANLATSRTGLGLLTTVAGGLLGSDSGAAGEGGSGRTLDERLSPYIYGGGGLVPRTQGLLGEQMPAAQTAGNQLMSVGSGLLGQTAPTTASNQYLKSIADDLQRRTAEMLAQNNLSIQGNAVATGGLGGSRQGVAQGIAAGQAADNLQGNVATLYGNAFNQDQNRLLQQQTLGAGLISQGLNTPFQPLQNASDIYKPYSGLSSANGSSGGLQGVIGGALGGAALANKLGWW